MRFGMKKIIGIFIITSLIISCTSGVSQAEYNQLVLSYNELDSNYKKTLEDIDMLIHNQDAVKSALNQTINTQNDLVEKYNDVLNSDTIVIQTDSEAIENLKIKISEIENLQNTKVDKSDYNQLVNYVNKLPTISSNSKSQTSSGNINVDLLNQVMCVSAQNYHDIDRIVRQFKLLEYDVERFTHTLTYMQRNGGGNIMKNTSWRHQNCGAEHPVGAGANSANDVLSTHWWMSE